MISSRWVVGFHRVSNLKIVKGLRDCQVVPAVFLFLLRFLKKIYLFYFILYFVFWLCWVFIAAHGLSLVEVRRLLIVVASLAGEHEL